MKPGTLLVALALTVGAPLGCVVEETVVQHPPNCPTGAWVKGHYGPHGTWHGGHWRCGEAVEAVEVD